MNIPAASRTDTFRPRTQAQLRWLAIVISVLAAFVLVACGDDDSNDVSTPTPGTHPSPGNGPIVNGDIHDIPRTTGADVSITGAGATFPNVLYSNWVTEYNAINSGIRVNYQSIGSGGGIRQIIERTVDFGATDGPMSDEQKAEAGAAVIHIPTAMGAIVPAYNLPGSPELRFSQDTIAAIFLGHVTRWSDERIAADNPGVDLPDIDLAVVHRSDGAGTTFIWADFLAAISDEWAENYGVATSIDWPRGHFLGGNGNEGVAGHIRQIPGAIGYVESVYAIHSNLSIAKLENHDGNFVEPTFEAVAAAAAGLIKAGVFPENMEARVVNAPGADSWPASGFTWILVYQDLDELNMNLDRAQELIRFLLWALDEDGGQQYAAPLHYAPLDPAVIAMAHDAIKTITRGGQPVWETMLR